MIHDLSDLEYYKLGLILDEFSHDCVVGDFNDRYVYIHEGHIKYRIERDKISPDIEAKDAVKYIVLFES